MKMDLDTVRLGIGGFGCLIALTVPLRHLGDYNGA